MGLFTNVGGELKELSSLAINVGGEKKEINSLTANIGGQPKEIFTMLPKNIYGTYHLRSGVSSYELIYTIPKNIIISNLKIPVDRKLKIKMTINITDGYVHKMLSSNREQFHMANLEIGSYDDHGSGYQILKCGSQYSNETKTSYTSELTGSIHTIRTWNVYARRWAGSALTSSDGIDTFYNNNLLSFDYSIEFELV